MKKQTFGMMVSSLRKEKGMTQLELADKMGVTDKAVSKWERDLSYPDINSISKLADILGVSVDELMQNKTNVKENENSKDLVNTIFKAVGMAMGIAVVVLSVLGELDCNNGKDGADGYTPVRGKDYWTADDIAEIKAYVDAAILGGVW